MWQGKKKALTFSYDDGVTQDRRLVEIFNRYGLKGTFNLNSGLMSEEKGFTENQRQMWIYHINEADVPAVYDGHEVAVHTCTHPALTLLSDEQLKEEIEADKAALERITGKDVVGMAYPYGEFDERVCAAVKAAGLAYSRTVVSSYDFALPKTPLTWAHTCHHNDERLFELAERFLATEAEEPQLFTVWGHSYEFDVNDNWDRIERFCALLAGRDDIFYATNREALGI